MLNAWQKLPETEKRAHVAAFVADLAPYEVELHLLTDPELPKRYGKAIKAAGGRYSEARGGGCLHRYVNLPSTARDLINRLVAEFGFWHGARSNDKVTMIARPPMDKLPTHVAVGSVTKALTDPTRCDSNPITAFEHKLARKVFAARAGGESCGALTNAEIVAHTQALAKRAAVDEARQRLSGLFYAAKPATLDEFDGLVEALAAFIERADEVVNIDNNVALARLDGVTKLLERAKAARVEFDAAMRAPALDAALIEILDDASKHKEAPIES